MTLTQKRDTKKYEFKTIELKKETKSQTHTHGKCNSSNSPTKKQPNNQRIHNLSIR